MQLPLGSQASLGSPVFETPASKCAGLEFMDQQKYLTPQAITQLSG